MAPPPSSYHSESFDYWNYNTAALLGTGGAGGRWFSLASKDEGKFWRNATVVKAINSRCQAAGLDQAVQSRGKACFDACPQPTNSTSACWVDCFFATVLGSGHNSSLHPTGGMPHGDVTAAWLRGFRSDDPAQGGCPACPASGSCPPPSALVEAA